MYAVEPGSVSVAGSIAQIGGISVNNNNQKNDNEASVQSLLAAVNATWDTSGKPTKWSVSKPYLQFDNLGTISNPEWVAYYSIGLGKTLSTTMSEWDAAGYPKTGDTYEVQPGHHVILTKQRMLDYYIHVYYIDNTGHISDN